MNWVDITIQNVSSTFQEKYETNSIVFRGDKVIIYEKNGHTNIIPLDRIIKITASPDVEISM